MYVYILASKSRCLYVGVTNDLRRRVYQHRTATDSFAADYRVWRLVYFEVHERPIVAIRREKRIKALLRKKKIALIEKDNPAWDDLADGWYDVSFSLEPGETA
ncbi:MAG: GIY-YIG nuclease family protein [Thermoanaerobaculia bacterium]